MKRIIFKHDLYDEATGDHPTFLMAKRGQGGVLVEEHAERDGFNCLVKWDGWETPFWASKTEFEYV